MTYNQLRKKILNHLKPVKIKIHFDNLFDGVAILQSVEGYKVKITDINCQYIGDLDKFSKTVGVFDFIDYDTLEVYVYRRPEVDNIYREQAEINGDMQKILKSIGPEKTQKLMDLMNIHICLKNP